MKHRVMARYFEDTSVMWTINMMTFVFRVVLSVSLLYFVVQHWNRPTVSNAVSLVTPDAPGQLSQIIVSAVLLLAALLGLGLWTRVAGVMTVLVNVTTLGVLTVAWAQGIDLWSNNPALGVVNPVTSYLPAMLYCVGYVVLAVFLLVVPRYALEFQSLDGKFFPTAINPTTTPEKDVHE